MRTNFLSRPRDRRGAALVYVVIVVVAMMALASLAVDLGRYEVAHSQAYNAAVAAARAGAADMASTSSTSTSTSAAAIASAVQNTIDGQQITASMVKVKYVKWTDATHTGVNESVANYSQANAVRVFITYDVPLPFAQVLGYSNKKAVEFSTAEVSVQVDTPYVVATGNPWLAGQTTTGTQASQPDPGYSSSSPNSDHLYKYDLSGPPGTNTHGAAATSSTYSSYETYASPVQIAFNVTPGATITITNTSGTVSYDHNTSPYLDPTANTASNGNATDAAANGVSEHGIADVNMPLGAMNGVFLGSGLPDNIATVPPPLDFSTQAARDYVGLQPKLQQPFYIGTGQTSTGTQQEITVPANATRMFMGIMDGWEWSNNNGGFNATVTQTMIITVE